jgi:hypothetical protein
MTKFQKNKSTKIKSLKKIPKLELSQQLSSKSNQMKSSRSLKIQNQNDSLEMENLLKHLDSVKPQKNISKFNTITEKFDVSEYNLNIKNKSRSNLKIKDKRRFSDGGKYNTFNNLNTISNSLFQN